MKRMLLFLVVTLAIHGQEGNETARSRVSEAVRRGNTGALMKLMAELTPTLTPAAPRWNTSYEEIRACGLYPQETRLACVIDIKQDGGFGGGISSFGSFEYVSFFIDWANDGFTSTDYVGSGIVNVPDGSAKASFAVYRDFNPPGSLRATPVTGYNALAKLSWTFPSIIPGAPVAWGNELAFKVRFTVK